MRTSNGNRVRGAGAAVAAAACGLGWAAAAAPAAVFTGNGATGFGGPVGTGQLAVTDNGAGSVTFSFTPGAGHPSLDGNNLVVYLSTGAAGGLGDTSPLTDNGDQGREAISGFNATNTPTATRTLVTFPTGFAATYGLSFEGGFVGLFKLPAANGDGGLTFVDGATQGTAFPKVLTVPLAELGLTQGQGFQLVGSDIDGRAAYRSNETFGATNPDVATGDNLAFTGTLPFSSAFTFTSTAVPEPAALAAVAVGAAAGLGRRRRAAR